MKFFTLLLISVVTICYAAEEQVQVQEQEQLLRVRQRVAPPSFNLDELIKILKETEKKIKASAGPNAAKINKQLEDISKQVKDLVAKYKAAVGPKAVKLEEKLLEITKKIHAAGELTGNKLEEKLAEITTGFKSFVHKIRERFRKLRNYFKRKGPGVARNTTKLAHEVVASCAEKIHISVKDVEALRTGDFLKQVVDEKSKLFVQCYFKGLGFIKDGKPQWDTIIKRMGSVFGPKKAMSTLIKCHGAGGKNDLDETFNDYACFFKNKAVFFK